MEMQEQINALDEQKISISLDNIYIPNTRQHQEHIHGGIISTESFISTVEESIIKEIMEMGDLITNNLKLLLMMGIGVFFEDAPSEYLEIIKELSHKQHLYLIIASSDYIYGTNYQFCHGFLGKDLAGMTQQKIIQAMGRVGRGNIQQTYTVRFRNNEILKQLFMPLENNGMNIEALVMNNLFLS
jgi:hypothetical protein